MTPAELVERVALAFCNKVPPCKMCRNDAKKAIAIALEEAARTTESANFQYAVTAGSVEVTDVRTTIAAAIRAMIPSGNDPASDDTGNAE
jgi:hypothetical protein